LSRLSTVCPVSRVRLFKVHLAPESIGALRALFPKMERRCKVEENRPQISMKTFGEVIKENRGYTLGFDYLRLYLAVGVIFLHSFAICMGNDYLAIAYQKWTILTFMIVPMFFCLSGFLVASSLLRCRSNWEFLGLRALRILPAFVAVICLTALILGPFLTNFSVHDYFHDARFGTYFENIPGIIHLYLPGVFNSNPTSLVNLSLWTIPYEMGCYIGLFLLAVAGIAKRPRILLALLIAGIILAPVIFHPHLQESMKGRQLVLCFMAGVTLFIWRNKVPHHPALFIACLVLFVSGLRSPYLLHLMILPMAYVTAYIGLLTPKRLPILLSGDYSYGIYLYGFPVQQVVYQFLPAARVWYLNFFASTVVVWLVAAFSWHAIERPALKLKRYLKKKDKAAPLDVPRPVLQDPGSFSA
jgi:peptidoglycan/LPS O-acetylase OafA/YrhL